MVLRIVIDVLLAVGAFFALVGTLGILRMPDTFCRMQASTCISTLGATHDKACVRPKPAATVAPVDRWTCVRDVSASCAWAGPFAASPIRLKAAKSKTFFISYAGMIRIRFKGMFAAPQAGHP